jgi:hypothetical protein
MVAMPKERSIVKTKHALLLAVVAAAASPMAAMSMTVGLHLASVHDKPGFNDTNPGVYIRTESGITAGTVFNSERKQSFHLGYTWERPISKRLSVAVTVGGITGYKLPVTPMVIPSAAFKLTEDLSLRVSGLARVNRDGANALHLSLEQRF